ncbi:hypothetical protein F0562_004787 [Nyssa sinensis]|uniref:Uncharacterized protein n=1 Tax=Nyssa sinensis TaxID=561372 RepID=A0A5J5AIT5_9ASTE|nr:hypothetical protein F0562_004787 [Nyssa sinensis]
MPDLGPLSQTSKEADSRQEQDHAIAARVLSNFRPKDEIKSIRRRDQNQGKRRMVKGYRDHLSNRSLKYQQWRPMDLLMDSIPESPTQKQNCFISLLPPPPPRTASRILPPSSSRESTPSLYPSTIRPTPAQVMDKKQDKWQEVPPPHDEHQRDENEWLHGKSEVIKKPIEKECPRNSTSTIVYGAKSIYRPFALPNTGKHNSLVPDHTTQNEETHFRTRLLRSLTPSPREISPIKTSRCCHMSRTINSGGHLPHRIAPAVQIRSVIPVCAAPPLPMRPPASMREVSSSSATSMSKITGGEVSPDFNKLQPYPTQLINSEFNNKLQL